MTAPSGYPPAVGPAPLLRRADDRVWKGVCAAVGRATGTDPVLWRVCLAVLAVFGGSGVLLYVAGWLLIPAEAPGGGTAQRRLHRSRTPLVLVLLAVAVVLGLTSSDNDGVAPLVAVGLLLFLVLRQRPRGAARAWGARPQGAPAWGAPPAGGVDTPAWSAAPGRVPSPSYAEQPPYAPPLGAPTLDRPSDPADGPAPGSVPVDLAPAWPPGGWQAAGWPVAGSPATDWQTPDATAPWQQPLGSEPALPKAPRRPVLLLVASAALVAVGLLLLLGMTGLVDVTLGRVLALTLLVLAGGQLATHRWGGSTALVALEVVLVVALGLSVAGGVDADLSAGARTWPVTGSADRELGAGDAVLDLRPLAGADDPATVTAHLALGSLRVRLPDGRRVALRLRVGAGQAVLPGEGTASEGPRLEETRTYGPPDGPLVAVDVKVGAGVVEVLRATR